MKFAVDDDDLYVPAVESNVTDCVVMDLTRNQGSPIYFDEDIDKDLHIDDISSIFHYELKADTAGGLGSDHSLEPKDELRYEDFNRLLHADEVIDLHPTIGLANKDEDYILNFDFNDRVPELDDRFCEELGLENSRSRSHSSGTSEVVLTAESSLLVPTYQKDQLGKTNSCKFERLSFIASRCETPFKDEMASNKFSVYHLLDNEEANCFLSPSESGSAYHKNEISTNISHIPNNFPNMKYDVGHVSESLEEKQLAVQEDSRNKYAEVRKSGTRIRLKRLCKTTQEYTKESTSSSKLRNPIVRLKKKHHEGDKIAVPIVCDKLMGRSSRRFPYAGEQESSANYAGNSRLCSIDDQDSVRPRRNQRRSRNCEEGSVDSDEEYDPVRSEVKRKRSKGLSVNRPALVKGCQPKCVDRRKHSRSWTLSEVIKLVDGISQFGVGRWTPIARAFFPSSCRTSLDIRDKWRNLVRSSSMKSNNKNEKAFSSRSKPIPRSLMQRVGELALLHPYPRRFLKDAKGSNAEPMLPLPQRSPSW